MDFRQTTLLILKAGIWIIQELHRIVHMICLFKGKGKFPAELYPHNHRKKMIELKVTQPPPLFQALYLYFSLFTKKLVFLGLFQFCNL